MKRLIRRWRYTPRRSAHLPHPNPKPAVDPWLHTSTTQILPLYQTYERTDR